MGWWNGSSGRVPSSMHEALNSNTSIAGFFFFFKKKRAGGVTQDEGPEFKPQYHKKKKEKISVTEDSVSMYEKDRNLEFI
jgi:hypothetical protein